MSKLDPSILVGKKIVKVDSDSCNMWHLTFDDGTEVSLTYWPTTVTNLKQLVLEKKSQ